MPRKIHIRPVLNGFVCSVGCQEIVCLSADELGAKIAHYYHNPEQDEADYIARAVNKMSPPQSITGQVPQTACNQASIPDPPEPMPQVERVGSLRYVPATDPPPELTGQRPRQIDPPPTCAQEMPTPPPPARPPLRPQ